MNTVIDMSAVSERKELTQTSEATALIAVIERAARDSSVDIEKMERLMAMHERIVARQAAEAYNVAFAEMQPELPEIDERGQIKVGDEVRSTYSTFEDINKVVKPILKKHGFGISFKPVTKDNRASVTTILMHRRGHREETVMELAADTSGSKNGVQALGSSISYAKRYSMCGILNITTRGQDDDGRRGGSGPLITEKQAADLNALVTELGGNKGKLLKYLRLKSFEEIPACNFDHIVSEVKRFAAARAERG